MRRMLHILKWFGLSLSTLLLAGILVLWVRSMGHREEWTFYRFEPRPDWTAPDLTGLGLYHVGYAYAEHGRLWLGGGKDGPSAKSMLKIEYRRKPISARQADVNFYACFQPGEWPYHDGTQRAWRFAGMGLRQWRKAVDPRLGRPRNDGFVLALPFWMLAVVFGLWPVGFVAWRLLRKKRHAPGHCPQCGYDLRATPDPAGPRLPRCPECGLETAAAQPAQPTPR